MHSSNIKSPTYVLEFLATWPLRYAVNIGLIIFLVCTTIAMIPHVSRPVGSPPAVNPSVVTNAKALAQHVADAHLFGQEPGQASGTAAAAPVAVIKVEGLLYSDDSKAALAILETNGTSGTYRVGDVLADGERLTAIAPTAVQLTQGMTQRVVEMPEQFGGPEEGIALTGVSGLSTGQFPGLASSSVAPTYQPALRAVSVPDGANPLEQLRSLRQQLIAPQSERMPSSAKHPAKP